MLFFLLGGVIYSNANVTFRLLKVLTSESPKFEVSL